MLGEGVFNLLSTDAGVLGLSAKVFSGLAPKEQIFPYVVISQVGAEPVQSFAGNNRLQRARLRFACCGGTYLVAKKLANAVKLALGGLLATLNDGTDVQGAWLLSEFDQPEADYQGTLFATHVDFEFNFVDNA
jgi:hypothetical protein